MKKVLIIDDSALMRRVLSDIIEEDTELEVSAGQVYRRYSGSNALAVFRFHSRAASSMLKYERVRVQQSPSHSTYTL